jgi:hypothetical protein
MFVSFDQRTVSYNVYVCCQFEYHRAEGKRMYREPSVGIDIPSNIY